MLPSISADDGSESAGSGGQSSGGGGQADGGGGLLSKVQTWHIIVAVGLVGLVVVFVIGATAGAVFLLTSGGNQADTQLVPEGADTVSYVNVDKATSSEAVRRLADAYLEAQANDPYYSGPTSYEEALQDFEDESGLDPDKLNRMTSFSKYDEETGAGAGEYSGTIIRSDWSEDGLIRAMERNGPRMTEEDYKGVTVYRPESGYGDSWVAVLGSGTYVIGTEDAVKDVIDVQQGDMASVSGELKKAFDGTRSGYVRFAMRVPERQVPDRQIGSSNQIGTASFRQVRIVSGAHFVNGNTVGTEIKFQTNSTDAAKDIEDVSRGSVSLARGMSEDDDVESALRDVTVKRNGKTVVITYKNNVDNVAAALEALGEDETAAYVGPVPAIAVGA